MKKGVVIKHHLRYTIVLRRDGSFVKAKPIKEKRVGAEVTYEEKEAHKLGSLLHDKPATGFRLVAMVMVLLLIASPLYLWNTQNRAYAYVSIDINPSVELEVNKDMEVIGIHAVNEDAKTLITMLGEWEDKPVDQITGQIVQISKKEDWLSEEKTVLIGISYEESGKKEAYVTKVLDDYFKKTENQVLTVAIFEVPKEIRVQAQEQKKSMNEVMAASLPSMAKSALLDQVDDQEREVIRTYFNYKKQTVEKEKAIQTKKDIKKNQEKSTSTEKKQDQNIEHSSSKQETNKAKKTPSQDTKNSSNPKQDQKKKEKTKQKQEKKQEKKSTPPASEKDRHSVIPELDIDEEAIRKAILEWQKNPNVIPPILEQLPEQIRKELGIELDSKIDSDSLDDLFDLIDR
ncbi:hypothetical protein KO561_05505 [Radiobacillus kanasensis]|uniref:anti-sigma-I factor RsgI family protein n=1 Tax=Radiobacillus kanasensis TaxID=2844358 RepID=UPI001E598E40|nr:hypothetical protein [Radiobacillus kanasensis]UFU00403.1 hypothetical protein KO561_05505 [Radiobacillus kanasensis]